MSADVFYKERQISIQSRSSYDSVKTSATLKNTEVLPTIVTHGAMVKKIKKFRHEHRATGESNDLICPKYKIRRAFTNGLNVAKNMTLSPAKKIYSEKCLDIKDKFGEIRTPSFQLSSSTLIFKNEKPPKEEYQWCINGTSNKIKETIKTNDINGDSRMIPLNAIFFNGLKKHPLRKKRAAESKYFYRNKRETVNNHLLAKGMFDLLDGKKDVADDLLQIDNVAQKDLTKVNDDDTKAETVSNPSINNQVDWRMDMRMDFHMDFHMDGVEGLRSVWESNIKPILQSKQISYWILLITIIIKFARRFRKTN